MTRETLLTIQLSISIPSCITNPAHHQTTMDPRGAAQPPLNAAYKVEGNPATANPAEEQASRQKPRGPRVENRSPGGGPSPGLQEAQPSALGAGVRGAPAGEEQTGQSMEQTGRHRELEGEQMRAPGEGDVSTAVEEKPGATGAEPDLASDLDR